MPAVTARTDITIHVDEATYHGAELVVISEAEVVLHDDDVTLKLVVIDNDDKRDALNVPAADFPTLLQAVGMSTVSQVRNRLMYVARKDDRAVLVNPFTLGTCPVELVAQPETAEAAVPPEGVMA